MTNLCDIPSDIFINYITNNINLSIVEKLTSVGKMMYCKKEELLKNLVISNIFLQTNIDISPDDLIDTINKSHFTFQSFQHILEGICNRDRNSIEFKFTNVQTSMESINSTFKIFQLFKKSTNIIYREYNIQFGHLVSKLLLDYFDEVFKKRSGLTKFNMTIIRFYFHNVNCNWHIIDINPYYIYENMNHILQSKRSYIYRQNIENRINICIDGSYENQEETVRFLAYLMCYGDTIRKVYIFYEIVKYMNTIHKHISLNNKMTLMCYEKINELRSDSATCMNKLPVFFKKVVYEEFDNFLELNQF